MFLVFRLHFLDVLYCHDYLIPYERAEWSKKELQIKDLVRRNSSDNISEVSRASFKYGGITESSDCTLARRNSMPDLSNPTDRYNGIPYTGSDTHFETMPLSHGSAEYTERMNSHSTEFSEQTSGRRKRVQARIDEYNRWQEIRSSIESSKTIKRQLAEHNADLIGYDALSLSEQERVKRKWGVWFRNETDMTSAINYHITCAESLVLKGTRPNMNEFLR
jgi:hypothetical protein